MSIALFCRGGKTELPHSRLLIHLKMMVRMLMMIPLRPPRILPKMMRRLGKILIMTWMFAQLIGRQAGQERSFHDEYGHDQYEGECNFYILTVLHNSDQGFICRLSWTMKMCVLSWLEDRLIKIVLCAQSVSLVIIIHIHSPLSPSPTLIIFSTCAVSLILWQ